MNDRPAGDGKPQIADLHVHLPMYVPPVRGQSMDGALAPSAPTHAGDLLESALVAHAGRDSGNYLPGNEARVSVPLMEQGGVRIAFSVLYSAFDEFAPAAGWTSTLKRFPRGYRTSRRYAPALSSAGATASLTLGLLNANEPPRHGAFARLLRRLENVERYVDRHSDGRAGFAHDPAELGQILAAGRVALIHCVEGGFHLGSDPAEVKESVRELARRGVAYITLGHLFYRGIATVAPAIPYLSERDHALLFPQPEEGLSPLSRAAIETMADEGIILDLCHLSERALEEAFALLDEIDPDRTMPVIASHTATRIGSQQYNVSDATIERIAERVGLIGLILATHQLADGCAEPDDPDGLEVLVRHIDRIAAVTGSNRHTAIGSDLGGFIEPLPEFQSVASLGTLRDELENRYGREDAARIAGENVKRLLMTGWRHGARAAPRSSDRS
jgi:microsomal dipeptidase-like Zn-dependent dipeptidase